MQDPKPHSPYQYQPPGQEALRTLLKSAKRIAVVGLSNSPERDSYRVARYLLEHGYEVIPVNPAVQEVLGRKAYASLTEVPGHIDIVDVFRRSEAVLPVAEEAAKVQAEALWLQLGISNDKAVELAHNAGLTVVQSACIKVEHSRLLGDF